jgi:quercetin dioxygenase-like cupin family protein
MAASHRPDDACLAMRTLDMSPLIADESAQWGKAKGSDVRESAYLMEIRKKRGDSTPGPREWFTGQVWMDEIATPVPPSRTRVLSVHFAPGARTAWHRHPFGQILHVTEGEGLVQSRDSGPEAIRAGDTVRTGAGEWHWHGAGPGTFMTHLAVQEADEDGRTSEFGEHVTDEEYRA